MIFHMGIVKSVVRFGTEYSSCWNGENYIIDQERQGRIIKTTRYDTEEEMIKDMKLISSEWQETGMVYY